MMSPPKSHSTSPGSSPSYFYDPSSPPKFFGYSEEFFSPVVSEESETDNNTSSESCDNMDEEERGVNPGLMETAEGGARSRVEHDDGEPSGTLLAQATRKLNLLKCDTTSLPKSEETANVVTGSSIEVETTMDSETTATSADIQGVKERTKTCKSELPSPKPSTLRSRSPPHTARRTKRVPSSPRTSFSGDLTDGERTPSKEPETHRKRRHEEENIVLIFREMILLHHIPSIMYIARECSVETLLHCATMETVAKDKAHVLLKDILSSRIFYDKLMSHNIPYLIYRSLTTSEKHQEQCRRHAKQEPAKKMAKSMVDERQSSYERQRSRVQEYLDILRDIAESSFGRKEMEHVLREQQKEGKLSAALSLPYLYR